MPLLRELPESLLESSKANWGVEGLNAGDLGNQEQPLLPEEVPASAVFAEGTVRQIVVNAYERNLKARKACIERYGSKCQVCEFDFAKFYGDIGAGFIHVHHRRDLASIGGEYDVVPIRDLIPVCPNCHAMLHAETPAMSIERLKAIVKSRRA